MYPTLNLVFDKVTFIVAECFCVSVGSLTLESRFVEDLNASLDFVEVIMGCEEAFGIAIPDEDAEILLTVGLLSAYLEARVHNVGAVWPPPPKMTGYDSGERQ